MKIKESAENYLEAILILNKRLGYARSIDVANYLGFSKPSVSVAMKAFREDGYITVGNDGSLLLTEKGKEVAERMYERHRLLIKALVAIGVDQDIAEHDGCLIEHDISNVTFQKIKEYLNKNGIY